MAQVPPHFSGHLLKGAKAPLSFYPRYFFDRDQDLQWFTLLELPQSPRPNKYYQTLLKSPLTYLGLNDLKHLFYYLFQQVLDFHHQNNAKADQGSEEYQLVGAQLEKLMSFINQNPQAEELQSSQGASFIELTNCYYLFYLALTATGARSRKLMGVANHHFLEFKKTLSYSTDDHHLYLSYLEAIIEVGRGNWDKATSILHRAIKVYPSASLTKLLCQLYISMGMPQVAKFVAKKYSLKMRPAALELVKAA